MEFQYNHESGNKWIVNLQMKTLDVGILNSTVSLASISPVPTEPLTCFREEQMISPMDPFSETNQAQNSQESTNFIGKVLTIQGSTSQIKKAKNLLESFLTQELHVVAPFSTVKMNNSNSLKAEMIDVIRQKYEVQCDIFSAPNLDSKVLFRGVYSMEASIFFQRLVVQL